MQNIAPPLINHNAQHEIKRKTLVLLSLLAAQPRKKTTFPRVLRGKAPPVPVSTGVWLTHSRAQFFQVSFSCLLLLLTSLSAGLSVRPPSSISQLRLIGKFLSGVHSHLQETYRKFRCIHQVVPRQVSRIKSVSPASGAFAANGEQIQFTPPPLQPTRHGSSVLVL